MIKKLILILFLFQNFLLIASSKPDEHAPISIMGDHIHKKKELMFSYRRMMMTMNGNYFSNGWHYNNNNIMSIEDIYDFGYNYYSQNMLMKMDMFGVMYGVSDKITIMIMLNFIQNEMKMNKLVDIRANTDDGHSHSEMKMNHSTIGIGDPSISFMISLYNQNKLKIHTNIGLSLPFGDITTNHKMGMEMHNQDHELLGHNHEMMRNSYEMQLGSGTIDPKISLTAIKYFKSFSYGSQIGGLFRFFENEAGYSNSSKYYVNSWVSKNINSSISISSTLSYNFLTSVSGSDNLIIATNTPESDIKNSESKLFLGGLAINYLFSDSFLNGLRLAVEFQSPIIWYSKGVKMKLDNQLTIGVQYSIH